MPTVEENRRIWNEQFAWSETEDNWSSGWGGARMQWFWSLLPRIQAFLPAPTILEIAPGYGRWTQYLKDHCERLTVVDLSEKCIEHCKRRFAGVSHIAYHVNDGRSLEMVAPESVDFLFSYDSFVHIEGEDVRNYLRQIGAKLTRDGVGMIHHSNLGNYLPLFRVVAESVHARDTLKQAGLFSHSLRAPSMTAELFVRFAEEAGLQVLTQELVNWDNRGQPWLIDCISIFTRKGSRWARPFQRLENRDFMEEQAAILEKTRLYGYE